MHKTKSWKGIREAGFIPVQILVIILVIAILAAVAIPALISQSLTNASSTTITTPEWNKIVVVTMENKQYTDVIGNTNAPYLNSLASNGASFTDSNEVSNGGLPNYLALFAGSTFGQNVSTCPLNLTENNLEEQLEKAGKQFTSYSQSMPSDGYTGCTSGPYSRTHNPTVNFINTNGATKNRTFGAFPTDYSKLPDVSFVVPDNNNNMKTAGATGNAVKSGDEFLRTKIKGYADWAKSNNSLLIVTWVENGQTTSRVPTFMSGANVKAGQYAQKINHYNVLAMIQDSKKLSRTFSTVGIPGIVSPFSAPVALAPSPTATATPTPSSTSTVSPSPTATVSPAPTGTTVPAPAPTVTPVPVPTATATASPAPTATPAPVPSVPASPMPLGVSGKWSMKFQDEFNGSTVDRAKWAPFWFSPSGVMNKVTTDPANVAVSNGELTLKLSDSTHGALLSSNPKGGATSGFEYNYGYSEARVFFAGTPSVVNNWPAWWTTGQKWPTTGENDIAEGLSGKMTTNYHSDAGASNSGTIAGSWGGTWHTYGLNRQPGKNDVYFDGKLVRSYPTIDNGAPHYFVLNVGASSATQAYGEASKMRVDYVRFWAAG